MPAPRGHLDLAASFRWVFPLDGSGSQAGGLLTIAGRWRGWMALVSVGVEDASSAPVPAGTGQVVVRRIPLRAGAAYELSLRRGALRFELGALAAVATAVSTGIAHPDQATFALPGLYAAVGYHLGLARHLAAFVALDFEYALIRESLQVTGTGEVATTPTLWLAPRLGLATDFL
jgi:hypothetical protein